MNKNNKTVKRTVPIEFSIHWRHLHQDFGKTWREISGLYTYKNFSKATICRHMKKLLGEVEIDKRKFNKGRPPKITKGQEKHLATSPHTKRILWTFHLQKDKIECRAFKASMR